MVMGETTNLRVLYVNNKSIHVFFFILFILREKFLRRDEMAKKKLLQDNFFLTTIFM